MEGAVSLDAARKRKHAFRDAQLEALINLRFAEHEDLGLILTLLDEYDPSTLVLVIKSQYGVDLVA